MVVQRDEEITPHPHPEVLTGENVLLIAGQFAVSVDNLL